MIKNIFYQNLATHWCFKLTNSEFIRAIAPYFKNLDLSKKEFILIWIFCEQPQKSEVERIGSLLFLPQK